VALVESGRRGGKIALADWRMSMRRKRETCINAAYEIVNMGERLTVAGFYSRRENSRRKGDRLGRRPLQRGCSNAAGFRKPALQRPANSSRSRLN